MSNHWKQWEQRFRLETARWGPSAHHHGKPRQVFVACEQHVCTREPHHDVITNGSKTWTWGRTCPSRTTLHCAARAWRWNRSSSSDQTPNWAPRICNRAEAGTKIFLRAKRLWKSRMLGQGRNRSCCESIRHKAPRSWQRTSWHGTAWWVGPVPVQTTESELRADEHPPVSPDTSSGPAPQNQGLGTSTPLPRWRMNWLRNAWCSSQAA